MTAQVLVRKKSPIGRDTELVIAEVLAEKQGGDVLRLKIRGVAEPVEMKRSETIPIGAVAPGQARIKMAQRLPEKAFPTARGALAHLLY